MMKIHIKRAIRRMVLAIICTSAAAAISAPVTIDIMFAYDQSAARWLASNGIDGGNLASKAVEKMNSVLPDRSLTVSSKISVFTAEFPIFTLNRKRKKTPIIKDKRITGDYNFIRPGGDGLVPAVEKAGT